MSVFQKYLRAVAETDMPRRRNLDKSVYRQAVDAWQEMRDGAFSPFDESYLHESSTLGLFPDEKIMLVFDWKSAQKVRMELSALHYLEALSDLDVRHVEHVGFMDRINLKKASRVPGMRLDLRNQTSNSIVAFNELCLKAYNLGAIEIDMLSRHEDSAQIKRAEEILELYPYAKYSQARSEARKLSWAILRDGFLHAVESDGVSND